MESPNPPTPPNALETARAAAIQAGTLLRESFHSPREVDELKTYDIKLALDRECQALITTRLLDTFPHHCLLGEEGNDGDESSPWQWIVDPLDGTVNFFYGIPHFCVSIALRHGDNLRLGVIHDPMLDETWTVEAGGTPTLNGNPIRVSSRDQPGDAIVTVGFSKTIESIDHGLARYGRIAHRVRKTRLMGSAALAMAYIACGRLDAYIEEEISLWDIAAGQLLIEAAGGTVILRPCEHNAGPGKFSIRASNARLPLAPLIDAQP